MFRKLLLIATAALVPLPAHASWQEARSKHFIVYSDDNPDRVRDIAIELERFDAALRLLMGAPDTRPDNALQRVTVYVTPELDDIHKLAQNPMIAGFFQRRVPGPFAFVPRNTGARETWNLTGYQILFHEYAHFFMASNWPDTVVPAWFSEGFAEFNATVRMRQDGQLMFGAVPQYRGPCLRRITALDARQMVLHADEKLDDEQLCVLYARGWLLTHYLMLDPDRAKQFGDYLAAINSGKSLAEAAKALGDLGALDGKLNAYLRRDALPTRTLSPQLLKVGEIAVRTVSAGEAATMMARITSQAGVDEKVAKEVVVSARAAAAPYPNDAAAQNELAEAEFDAGNNAASEAAVDRALAADPKSIHALVYKGMVHMRLAEIAKTSDPKVWAEARKWFIAANQVNTENPWPLALYFQSFAAAHEKPTRNAEAALAYAYALAPFDLQLRYAAGVMFLEQNDVTKARAALEPIAFQVHGGEGAEFMGKVVAVLDGEGGTTKALAMLKDHNAQLKAKAEQAGKDKKKEKKD